MINLQGQVGELHLKVQVTRKETGKVEEYDLIGFLGETELKELTNGSDPLNSGTERSD